MRRFGMQELLLIVAVTAAVLYWLSASRCKDLAIATARRECKLHEIQLLDQTVHQHHLSMSRDEAGTWRVWRQYNFEYSDNGVDRLKGTLVMLGTRVLRVSLETFNPIVH